MIRACAVLCETVLEAPYTLIGMAFILDFVLLELVLGVLLLIWLYYMYSKSCYSYWKNRLIAYAEPTFPFGTDKDLLFLKASLGHHYQSFYTQFKEEKVVGLYANTTPYLMIRDPELLKHVMTKDFHHFVDRGMVDPEVLSPAFRHLFHMKGESWKVMRHKLTPAFTSGKMKLMYYLMETCSEEFVKALEPLAEKNKAIQIKDFIACFTTDVIASCAFGLQSNSIQNPDNEFRKNGNKIFESPPLPRLIKHRIAIAFPWLFKKLFKPLSSASEDFFLKMVGDTIAYREKNGVARNDFIDILIKIKNNKSLLEEDKNDDTYVQKEAATSEPGLMLEEMTAQALLFFAAGFETAASTLSFCLYEISVNREIQQKMRSEVDAVLTKYNGKLTYQALQDMTYMGAVINETLRRYSSLGILNRECTEEYKIPDVNLVIPKGMKIIIPVYAIHHDPEYYPDPYKFDPERFTDEKINTKHNYTFIPFGEGPRMCIGNRFAMMQMKMCLSMLLDKFEFKPTNETPKCLNISKKHFITTPESSIILHICKR